MNEKEEKQLDDIINELRRMTAVPEPREMNERNRRKPPQNEPYTAWIAFLLVGFFVGLFIGFVLS
jgi:hypothetical protein